MIDLIGKYVNNRVFSLFTDQDYKKYLDDLILKYIAWNESDFIAYTNFYTFEFSILSIIEDARFFVRGKPGQILYECCKEETRLASITQKIFTRLANYKFSHKTIQTFTGNKYEFSDWRYETAPGIPIIEYRLYPKFVSIKIWLLKKDN